MAEHTDEYDRGYQAGYRAGSRRQGYVAPEETGITFPVPIRDDVVIRIHNIPDDLNEKEADRICAVVRALAVKEQPK